ncbi:MAG: hypothetical protein Q7S77_01915 [Candidatus Staskawiczbacteria bacterium]|nr:hypothetical protein [Candidatus Staskawiczbacteria bacterium]
MNEFASANLTAGQLNAIVKKLGGEEGAMSFLRDETVVKTVTPVDFKVFKTIKFGNPDLRNADDFRKAIKAKKMQISDWANDILGKPAFSVATEESEVDLVVISVAELGFKKGATLKDIYAKVKERGLELCPNEVGPQLRLQYPDQPKGEWLIIGMDPIAGSDGCLKLFYVEQGGGVLWLFGSDGYPDFIWRGLNRFVFVLPRK